MLLRTSVALVAPSMFAPFFRHWYCKPTPDAVTLRNTLAPSVTLVLCGGSLVRPDFRKRSIRPSVNETQTSLLDVPCTPPGGAISPNCVRRDQLLPSK